MCTRSIYSNKNILLDVIYPYHLLDRFSFFASNNKAVTFYFLIYYVFHMFIVMMNEFKM